MCQVSFMYKGSSATVILGTSPTPFQGMYFALLSLSQAKLEEESMHTMLKLYLLLSTQQVLPETHKHSGGTWGCSSTEGVEGFFPSAFQQLLALLQAMVCAHALCQPLLLHCTLSLMLVSFFSVF